MKLSHLCRLATLLAVLSLVLSLSGCVVREDGHEHHDDRHEDHHDDRHDDHR